MKTKFLIHSFFVVIAVLSFGCIESQKLPAFNETKLATPESTLSIIGQKLPPYNETKPLKINVTFETWSRGYWSNLSYKEPYFKVITSYNEWVAFLEDQEYLAWKRGEVGMRLEGQLYPGLNVPPKTIETDEFNNYFIMAAMMGLRGAAEGPEIEIKNINRMNNVVNVTVRTYDPRRGVNVISAPYHIVIVERELLPIGNSTFVFISTDSKELGKVEVKNE